MTLRVPHGCFYDSMKFYKEKQEKTMTIQKCSPGYISYKKKISIIWILVFIAIGVAVFLAGYFWTHTRANLLTVLAVLMVLPAAKRVVALVVMLPRKSVSKERYELVKQAVGEGVLFSDYVFTSTEKIMHLDFVVIRNGNVLAVIAPSKQDRAYMKNYLESSVHKVAADYRVRVFDGDEALLAHMKKLTQNSGTPEKDEKVTEYLRTLAV